MRRLKRKHKQDVLSTQNWVWMSRLMMSNRPKKECALKKIKWTGSESMHWVGKDKDGDKRK